MGAFLRRADEGSVKARCAAFILSSPAGTLEWAYGPVMLKRPIAALAFACLAGAALAAGQRDAVLTFDADRTGQPPPGFTFAAMRQASPGEWIVGHEGTAGRLEHLADPASHGYSLAIAPGDEMRDVSVSVRLRLVAGARSGGVVWSYRDASNYHAAVLDLVRAELNMYRVSGGNRVKVESKDDLELDAEGWHTLKASQANGEAWVSLGGIRVFEERLERAGRDGPGGRTGLIATGDSTVWFDQLRVEVPRARRGGSD
jgi:hypothetical protein